MAAKKVSSRVSEAEMDVAEALGKPVPDPKPKRGRVVKVVEVRVAPSRPTPPIAPAPEEGPEHVDMAAGALCVGGGADHSDDVPDVATLRTVSLEQGERVIESFYAATESFYGAMVSHLVEVRCDRQLKKSITEFLRAVPPDLTVLQLLAIVREAV